MYNFQNRVSGWKKYSEELTNVIFHVIDFAKSIELFQKLNQNEQILLLKRRSFQMAIIVAGLRFNVDAQTLNVNSAIVPLQMLLSAFTDAKERRFADDCLRCLSALAQLRLTVAESALLSALVLLEDATNTKGFVLRLRETLCAQMSVRDGAYHHNHNSKRRHHHNLLMPRSSSESEGGGAVHGGSDNSNPTTPNIADMGDHSPVTMTHRAGGPSSSPSSAFQHLICNILPQMRDLSNRHIECLHNFNAFLNAKMDGNGSDGNETMTMLLAQDTFPTLYIELFMNSA